MPERVSKLYGAAFGILLLCLVAGAAMADTVEIKNGTILGVNGNVLTVRGPDGVKEYTVPEGFKFDLDGKLLSVHELKPGMPIAAVITTVETPLELVSTEVRDAEVVHTIGSAFAVRTPDGDIKRFSAKDLQKRNVGIFRDGKQISPYDLKTGDKITATIITEAPPEILTTQQIEAFVEMPPEPKPIAVAQARPTPAPAPAPPAPRQLPKTASRLPWVALAGLISLALGAGLTLRRVIAS